MKIIIAQSRAKYKSEHPHTGRAYSKPCLLGVAGAALLLGLGFFAVSNSATADIPTPASTPSVSTAQSAGSSSIPPLYVNALHGYSLNSPTGWKAKAMPNMPIDVLYYLPPRPGHGPGQSTIVVAFSPLSTGMTLQGLAERWGGMQSQAVPNYRELSQERTRIDGVPALHIYQQSRLRENTPLLKEEVYLVFSGGWFIEFVYTNQPDDFAEHAVDFHAVIQSVRWLATTGKPHSLTS